MDIFKKLNKKDLQQLTAGMNLDVNLIKSFVEKAGTGKDSFTIETEGEYEKSGYEFRAEKKESATVFHGRHAAYGLESRSYLVAILRGNEFYIWDEVFFSNKIYLRTIRDEFEAVLAGERRNNYVRFENGKDVMKHIRVFVENETDFFEENWKNDLKSMPNIHLVIDLKNEINSKAYKSFLKSYDETKNFKLDKETLDFCTECARQYLLLGKEHNLYKESDFPVFEDSDVYELLTETMDVEREITRLLKEKEGYLYYCLATAEKIKELIDNKSVVLEWEMTMAKALDSVKCKKVDVVIELEGEDCNIKMDTFKLKNTLADNVPIDVDFSVPADEREFLENDTNFYDGENIVCNFIKKIIHKGNVIFDRTDKMNEDSLNDNFDAVKADIDYFFNKIKDSCHDDSHSVNKFMNFNNIKDFLTSFSVLAIQAAKDLEQNEISCFSVKHKEFDYSFKIAQNKNAVCIYRMTSEEDEKQTQKKSLLVAVVRDEQVYVFNEAFFFSPNCYDLSKLHEMQEIMRKTSRKEWIENLKDIPNVHFVFDFKEKTNLYVFNNIFPKLYDKSKKVMLSKKYENMCFENARGFLLDKSEDYPFEEEFPAFNENDILYLLKESNDIEKCFLDMFRFKEKDLYYWISSVRKFKEFVTNENEICSFEIRMADALCRNEAESFMVEFSFLGKLVQEEVDYDDLINALYSVNPYICLREMEYPGEEDGIEFLDGVKIHYKHITRIMYKGYVIYERYAEDK